MEIIIGFTKSKYNKLKENSSMNKNKPDSLLNMSSSCLSNLLEYLLK